METSPAECKVQEDVAYKKKRKSNFDVMPDHVTTTTLTSNLTLGHHLINSIPAIPGVVDWIPVTEPKFKARLSSALRRNIDFIKRSIVPLYCDGIVISARCNRKDAGLVTVPNVATSSGKFAQFQQSAKIKSNVPKANAGIGAPQSVAALPEVACVSVYVSGLPTDITEEELDILFSSQGKIKKIKIYMDSNGTKKGDALVTYTRPDAVDMACKQFNNLNIGDGFVISVVRADFKTKESSVESKEGVSHSTLVHTLSTVTVIETITAPSSSSSSSPVLPNTSPLIVETLHRFPTDPNEFILVALTSNLARYGSAHQTLPAECQADKYPVVLLWDAYDSVAIQQILASDPNFLVDLESDLLLECCKYGKVLRLISPMSPAFDGCVVVTYANACDAESCKHSLDQRWFDGRQIHAQLLLPRDESTPNTNVLHQPLSATTLSNDQSSESLADGADVQDVEDFLNSFL